MHAKKNLHLFVFILLVIFSLFLVSCGEDEETPAAEEPAAEQPVAEQPTAEAQQPAVPQEGAIDTGFRPEVDGFAYQNYGDVGQTPTGETFDVVNLTPIEMRRMFGDEVCASKPKKNGSR